MPAQRIVSLLASATEILFGLGLGDRVVGVSHECDYPAGVAGKPRITSTRVDAAASSGAIDRQVREQTAAGQALYDIDVPRLAALAPDLIVTQAQCDVCAVRYADVLAAVEQQPELQHAQVVALNPQTFDDVLEDIRRVAAAAGCEAAGERYVSGLAERVESVRATAAAVPSDRRPRVACIEWIEPLMLAGNWTPEMVAWAGGQNLLTTPGEHSPYCRWESLQSAEPEVVVIGPCGFDLARTLAEWPQLAQLPGWSGLPAVRSGRVYAVDGNAYFNRSGPRMVDSLEILAHLIHPGLFAAPPDSQGESWQPV